MPCGVQTPGTVWKLQEVAQALRLIGYHVGGGWLGEGSSNPGSRFPGVGYWPGWRLSSGAEA